MAGLIRVERAMVPFAQVPHDVLEDDRLSWKAKGIYGYLAGRPGGWEVHRSDLVRRSTDGKHSLQTGVEELQAHGYLSIQRVRDGGGRITGSVWRLHLPGTLLPTEESPYPDFPDMEKPEEEKPEEENQGAYQESFHQKEDKQESEHLGARVEEMHEEWKEITGNTRWQLLPVRKKRYRDVWEDLGKLLDEDQDRMEVWRVMVRCLWSDTWRQGAKSRHDPDNVYRTATQRENWILDALEEMAAGRDGSDWGERHRNNGGRPSMDQAREEEAGIVAARLQAAGRTAREERQRESREKEAHRRHVSKLDQWYQDQDEERQDQLKTKAKNRLREMWNLGPNRPAPRGLKKATWVRVLEEESGIYLSEEFEND